MCECVCVCVWGGGGAKRFYFVICLCRISSCDHILTQLPEAGCLTEEIGWFLVDWVSPVPVFTLEQLTCELLFFLIDRIFSSSTFHIVASGRLDHNRFFTTNMTRFGTVLSPGKRPTNCFITWQFKRLIFLFGKKIFP